MTTGFGASLLLPLPERVDRTLRLGPFPSAKAALRFVAYAAVGSLFVPIAGAWAWLPFLGVGFLVAVYRPDGVGLDRRCVEYVRYRWRVARVGARSRNRRSAPTLSSEGRLVRTKEGTLLSLVRGSGMPIAFLPANELQAVLLRYRELLRALDGSFACFVTGEPIVAAPFVPRGPNGGGADGDACRAYEELVRLLCHRRFARQVWVVLVGGPADRDRLERRTALFGEGLSRLGLDVEWVQGRSAVTTLERLADGGR